MKRTYQSPRTERYHLPPCTPLCSSEIPVGGMGTSKSQRMESADDVETQDNFWE
ncbi:MAG: hypothetical protein PUI86_01335 [Bacteroidales bacterium]|nr:hypothetical protein [Bacteroidales bacterium]MEE0904226.1 hypothetical protein [Prevotellamassilia sp.]